METRGNIVLITLDDNSQIIQKRMSAFNIENLLWKTKTRAILNTSDKAYKHNLNRINKYMTKTTYDVFATITNDNLLYADTDRALVVTVADIEKDKLYATV